MMNQEPASAVKSPPIIQAMTQLPNNLITCTPGIRSGKPSVSGTRITVSDVLEHIQAVLNDMR